MAFRLCGPSLVLAALAVSGLAPPLPKPKPLAPPPVGALRPKGAPAPGESSPADTKVPVQAFGTTPPPWPQGSTDPRDFPAGFPRVEEARIAAYSMSGAVATAYFVCGLAPQAVVDPYRAFVAREGWAPVPFPGPPLQEGAVLMARKGDWSLRVDASRNPLTGETEAFVQVMLKPLPPAPKSAEPKAAAPQQETP